MIEFKQDPFDCIYKYIEINPRLGMCNFFDTSCGVNNAFTTYQLALGVPLEKSKRMKENVIFVSFYEDLFSRLSDGEYISDIFREYLINLVKRKHIYIYFSWRDPYPAIKLASIQILSILKSVWRKCIRR